MRMNTFHLLIAASLLIMRTNSLENESISRRFFSPLDLLPVVANFRGAVRAAQRERGTFRRPGPRGSFTSLASGRPMASPEQIENTIFALFGFLIFVLSIYEANGDEDPMTDISNAVKADKVNLILRVVNREMQDEERMRFRNEKEKSHLKRKQLRQQLRMQLLRSRLLHG
uniref:Corticotropin-releasing factor domain-containing protein n=1 Tax=Strigamia maritima TaxID=126957 RepID=T1J074_STRMM